MVHAIDEIDVRMARRSKQHLVPLGLPGSRVRCEIALAEIDLDFDDASRTPPLFCTIGQCTNENFAQQLSCYDPRVTRVELLGQDPFAALRHLGLRLPA